MLSLPPGSTVSGTVKVVRFNWPKYAAAAAVLAAAAALSGSLTVPLARALLWAAAAPGLAWSVTSLAATWWVYDHRRVYEQLAVGLADIGDWAVVHAGFDESAAVLRQSIGRQPAAVARIDLRPGPSLRRARKLPVPTSQSAAESTLPAACADCIFVTFAAHEVRDTGDQQALFDGLRRALRPGGRLVVTEHPRNLATAAVYGPGALHFQPLSTWRSRAAKAGLTVDDHTLITPFVHRLVWRR